MAEGPRGCISSRGRPPLVFAMFYSVLTGASFGQVFGSVAFLWPYLGFVVPLGMVVGLFDLLQRRRRPPEVDAEESEED